jgi:hypothetical protein
MTVDARATAARPTPDGSVGVLSSAWWWAASAIVAGAVALRLAVVSSHLSPYEADSAVTGLMARHIGEGEQYLFFAGQRYMGTAEQYGTALVVALFGEDSLTLRVVGCVLSGVATALVILLFRRIASPARALVAGLVVAVGPSAAMLYAVYPRGAHQSAQVLCLMVACLCVAPPPWRARRVVAIAVLAGAGVWLSATTLVVLVPLLIWFAPQVVRASRASRRGALAVAAGVLLGFAWLPLALATGGWTWSVDPPPGEAEPFIVRLVGVLLHQVPQALGLESSWLGGWAIQPYRPLVPGVAGWVVLLPLYVLVAALALHHRRQVLVWWRDLVAAFGRPVRPAPASRPPGGFVLVVLVLLPFAVAASAMSFRTNEPRYLVTVFPLLACSLLLLGTGPTYDDQRRGRRPSTQVAAVAGALLVSVSAATTLVWLQRESDARDGAVSAEQCYDAAADSLVAAGVDHVAGSYWQIQPLDLAGRGRYDTRQTRIRDEFTAFQADPAAGGTWALAADGADERALFAERLQATGHSFTTTPTCAGLTVFTGFSPSLTPAEISDPVYYNWFGN